MNDVIARLTTALADRYRVTRELGAGGMATVYLAHDLRHERDVAIKVLHPDLGAALGGERFLTEIRTTARLQHPHILPLLDSGEADGLLFYVMPFIAGETLRARLDRERQLPIDEAVLLAREVADALQHAHDAGIVHRDIKPDNILLQGGHAVVADFGIALAVQQAAGQRLTQTGLSLGTPQYMAPEQATGERTIDARADVYALGAVVYEMLTGEPPFTGATSQAVVARLLTVAPAPMSQVRSTVPAALEEAVMRALAKLPADRFATARAFAEAMQRALGTATATVAIPSARVTRSRLRDPAVLGLAAVAAVAIGWSGYRTSQLGTVGDARMTAAVLPLELRNPGNLPFTEISRSFALANDGSFVVYVGADPEDPNATLLWRRDLDKLTAIPIGGTRNAQGPRISEDSKTIYFLARTKDGLRNVQRSIPSGGGPARDVMLLSDDVWLDMGGRMLRLDTLSHLVTDLSSDLQSGLTGIAPPVRVPIVPSTSPDRTHVLIARRDSVAIHRIGEASRRVIASGTWARFIDDHTILLLTSSNTMMAARLNDDRTALASKPLVVLENVGLSPSQRPMFDLAADGTAIYATGGDVTASRLLWVRRDGSTDSIPGTEPRSYTQVRLSRDDRDVAVSIGPSLGQGAVWVERLGLNRRVPIAEQNNGSATWLPDGRTVAYPRARVGAGWGYTVMSRPAEADQPEDTVSGPWPPDRMIAEIEFAASGAQLVRTMFANKLDRDVWGRVDGRSAFFKVAADSGVQERAPRFSPDGKWVSYVSDFTKREEVYVQPFPGSGGRVQVSIDGGREPAWSRDGRALYYRALDGWMMEVPVNGSLPNFGQPRRLFDASPFATNQFTVQYDVARDGRFLMWKRMEQSARTDVVIIRNWIGWVQQQIDASK